ncbi:MAG: DUF4339 domain-containing protein, partial [Planctomycetales bacterium]
MGIKFFCPNGHKLNVKDYLAGKKGICPNCNSKFLIPEASTKSKVEPLSEIPRGDTVRGQSAPTVSAAPGVMMPPTAMPQRAGEMPIQPLQQPGAPNAEVPMQPVIEQAGAPPSAAAIPVTPVVPSPGSLPDPLANTPADAVWYIRLPSGDQYGPANTDEMKGWLDENRVTADALVWCESWPEWKRADETFPKFQGGSGSPSAPGSPAAPAAPTVPTVPIPASQPSAVPKAAAIPQPAAAIPQAAIPGVPAAQPARPAVPAPAAAAPRAAVPIAQAAAPKADESTDTLDFLASMEGPPRKQGQGEEAPIPGGGGAPIALIIGLLMLGGLGVVVVAGVGFYLAMEQGDDPGLLSVPNTLGSCTVLLPMKASKVSDPSSTCPSLAGEVRVQDFAADARER